MGRKESDLSGLLVSLRSWKYAAKRDQSKDIVRNSTRYTEIIGITDRILSPRKRVGKRFLSWNAQALLKNSPRRTTEGFSSMERSATSEDKLGGQSNRQIKVIKTQELRIGQRNRTESRSSLSRQQFGFHRCIHFSKLGNAH